MFSINTLTTRHRTDQFQSEIDHIWNLLSDEMTTRRGHGSSKDMVRCFCAARKYSDLYLKCSPCMLYYILCLQTGISGGMPFLHNSKVILINGYECPMCILNVHMSLMQMLMEGLVSTYYTDIDRDGWNITFRWTAKRVIFSKGLYFPEVRSTEGNIVPRENITILAPPTRDISSVPVDICYIRWSKWMISSTFFCALRLPRSLVTRLGVCVQNKTEHKLDSLRAFYYDVLLLTTAYSVHFFLGQFPNLELMLLLSPLFYILNRYMFAIASLRLI